MPTVIQTVHQSAPEEFLPSGPENNAFYKAYARAGVPNFQLGFIEIKTTDQLRTIAPFFITKLTMGAMLPTGFLQNIANKFSIKIAFVGHPSTDFSHIEGGLITNHLEVMNEELYKYANLICYKGFMNELSLDNFLKVKGLPIPILKVSPDFWQELSHKKRTDLKRKLKASQTLKCSIVDGLQSEYVNQVHQLYEQTRLRSKIQFEELNIQYFIETGSMSKYILFFESDELIGFHQLMIQGETMICKYLGMNYEKSNKYKLYFALLIKSIDVCIEEKIHFIDFGVTSYTFKKYLGSEQTETFNYFQHKNKMINLFMRFFSFALEPDPKELI